MKIIRCRLFALLALPLFWTACGDDVSVLPNDGGSSDGSLADVPTIDGGTDPAAPCELPADLSVREGGRLRMTRTGPWLEGELQVEAPAAESALAIVREAEVVLYAPYGTTSAAYVWQSERCGALTLNVEVMPLEWTLLADWEDDGDGPPAREYSSFWIDGEAVHIYGGFQYEPEQFTPANDYWRLGLDTHTWTEVALREAPFVPGARAAMDESGSVLIHGGGTVGASGLSAPRSLLKLNNEGSAWETAPSSAQSPAAYTGMFVYDELRDRFLSICDLQACRVAAYSPEAGWTGVATEGEQPGWRIGSHFAFDEEGERVVFAGGQSQVDPLGDTWALELAQDPPRWVRLFDEDPRVTRRNGAYVWDPEGRRLLLWGGTSDGRSGSPGLAILRVEEGHERWDFVDVDAVVAPRASGFAVYDASGKRAIMGLGNTLEARYRDLWALSL